MRYLYETHLHTALSSACGISYGPEYISRYIDLGYSGIIVTDHFFQGNTAINRRLHWRDWVNEFCRGYEETKEEGDRQGLDVFFGWEETFDGADDYLVYGLDKAWLLEHPESRSWSRGEQYRIVNEEGGCVVQAHTFRQHFYIPVVHLSSGCVNAVEAANAGNHEQSYDALAMRYAQKLKLTVTAGSDIHTVDQFNRSGQSGGEDIFGIYLNKKMETIADYVTAIKENKIAGLRASPGRCNYHGDETVSLPVDIRDKNDKSTRKTLVEFFR
jgi:hypothetical protein